MWTRTGTPIAANAVTITTPVALTTNTDNWSLSISVFETWVYASSTQTGGSQITGIVPTGGSQRIKIWNTGAQPLFFMNQNSGSISANQFQFGSGGTITLATNMGLELFYDTVNSAWRD